MDPSDELYQRRSYSCVERRAGGIDGALWPPLRVVRRTRGSVAAPVSAMPQQLAGGTGLPSVNRKLTTPPGNLVALRGKGEKTQAVVAHDWASCGVSAPIDEVFGSSWPESSTARTGGDQVSGATSNRGTGSGKPLRAMAPLLTNS
jgi:hypothetical protein